MENSNAKHSEVYTAVKQVTDMFGIEIIADHKRFCAAMKDIAPRLTKESKAFFVALSEKVGEIYLRENEAVLGGSKNAADVIARANGVIEEYLNKEKADMVTGSLAYALGWKVENASSAEESSSGGISGGTLIEDLMRQAQNGNNDAFYNLGECFYYGRGVEQNYTRAIDWYTRSASNGDCSSQKKLAYCYHSGKGTKTDIGKAVYWYEKAAEQGDYDSQKSLIYCYKMGGLNFAADPEKARKYAERYGIEDSESSYIEQLMRGAESGSAGMQYELGNAYYNGKEVPADRERAVYWYSRAAEQNYTPALYNLACCCISGTGTEKDPMKAARLYGKAAKNGELDAMNNLAALYFRGDGVEKDLKRAAELWLNAAEKGLARAQYNYGECKFNGWGTLRNFNDAFKWYKKAAEQSDPDAQYSLGWCYYNGLGTYKDYNQAKRLFELSAQNMNIQAQKSLGYYHFEGKAAEKNYSRAAEWFGRAAARGDKEAAKMYIFCWKYGGFFLLPNEKKALEAADLYGIDYDLV